MYLRFHSTGSSGAIEGIMRKNIIDKHNQIMATLENRPKMRNAVESFFCSFNMGSVVFSYSHDISYIYISPSNL